MAYRVDGCCCLIEGDVGRELDKESHIEDKMVRPDVGKEAG
jgi:hypothetical protein